MLVWPRQSSLSVTVRHHDGFATKIPLWMLEPCPARIDLRDRVELSLPTWVGLAALLESHAVASATILAPRNADAQTDLPRSRPRDAGSAGGDSAPECKPTLIDVMAQAIVAVWLGAQEVDDDEH